MSEVITCGRCRGTGAITRATPTGPEKVTCPVCNGTGKVRI